MDVDTAVNFDDAMALALACTSPEIDLVGVSVSSTRVIEGTDTARRLLAAFGRQSVPVAPVPQGTGGVGDKERASALAAEFMAQQLVQHGTLTIVATGPLTNLATLLMHYPGIERHVQRLIFMGGWTSQALPETNFSSDPEAVATVLASSVPITCVGYEVTRQCVLRRPQLLPFQLATDAGPKLLYSLYVDWTRRTNVPAPPMHDPLTVALLCEPSLVKTEPRSVRIETGNSPSRGTLYLDPGYGTEIEMCTAVHAPRYLSLLLQRVLGRSTPAAALASETPQLSVRIKAAYRTDHFPGWNLNLNQVGHHVIAFVKDGECTVQDGSGHITRKQSPNESERTDDSRCGERPVDKGYGCDKSPDRGEGMRTYGGGSESEFRSRGPDSSEPGAGLVVVTDALPEEGPVRLSQGGVLYVRPNQSCRVETEPGMAAFWFHFEAFAEEGDGRLITTDSIGLPTVSPAGSNSDVLTAQAQRVWENWMYPWPEGVVFSQASLMEFIGYVMAAQRETEAKRQDLSPMLAALSKAKQYIEARLTETISLDDICAYAGISKSHLIRSFKEVYDMTPVQYHLNLRLERAKQLLTLDYVPISDIALSLGYGSINAFSRAFSSHVGMPPREYRRLYGTRNRD